ncbi:CASP-like protein [Apostasia shenzhenica]|uniref:CASP-like protein n=1 Tax=Apostasia shenzhenica TaxID=1088818 RepID=A0A2I0AWM3_9ASPA|nr:CASP-like protein [Apostasia shenzhenica]
MNPGKMTACYCGRGEIKGAFERRLRMGELGLRIAVLGLGLAAASLVGFDRQVRLIFSMEKTAKFTDMNVMVFLVAANGLAAGYSLLQGMRCVVGVMKGSVVFNKRLAWVIFSCDQFLYLWRWNSNAITSLFCMSVMAYLTLSVVASAAQSAVLVQFGQPELQWMKVCNLYMKFCTQAGEGLGSAFMASMGMIVISFISAFNLFRLYGSNKGSKNSNGNW